MASDRDSEEEALENLEFEEGSDDEHEIDEDLLDALEGDLAAEEAASEEEVLIYKLLHYSRFADVDVRTRMRRVTSQIVTRTPRIVTTTTSCRGLRHQYPCHCKLRLMKHNLVHHRLEEHCPLHLLSLLLSRIAT